MNYTRLIISVIIMAVVTYSIRVLPMLLCKKPLKNRFIRSFLFFLPNSVLSAMTFPAIIYSTDSIPAACVGLLVALLLSYYGKGLIIVASATTAAAFLTARLINLC